MYQYLTIVTKMILLNIVHVLREQKWIVKKIWKSVNKLIQVPLTYWFIFRSGPSGEIKNVKLLILCITKVL